LLGFWFGALWDDGFVQHKPAVDYSSTAGLFVPRFLFIFLFLFFLQHLILLFFVEV
jgi:hypothetical protein